MDAELRVLLQALPTKMDIKSLISRLEEQHRRDFLEVKRDVQPSPLSSRLENHHWSRQQRLFTLESFQDTHASAEVTLQLHMEDRSLRYSLRLRGLPEVPGPENLAVTAVAIFRRISDDTLPRNWNLTGFTGTWAPNPPILSDRGM